MFQKLYRHLEEINTSLREDRASVGDRIGETIVDQLKSMNATLHGLQDQMERKNNANTPTELRQRKPFRQMILWVVLAVVVTTVLLFMAFTVAQVNRSVSDQAVNSAHIISDVASTLRSADSSENRSTAELHFAKLDSLIAEQDQAIVELKKLNIIAVATLQRIRRHFALAARSRKQLSLR